MNKLNSKGFGGAIVIFIVCAVMAMVALAGYYAYKAGQSSKTETKAVYESEE